jgi:hypothetical protein
MVYIKKDWVSGEIIDEADLDALENAMEDIHTRGDAHIADTDLHLSANERLSMNASTGSPDENNRILVSDDMGVASGLATLGVDTIITISQLPLPLQSITDAGSGIIITDAERTSFTNHVADITTNPHDVTAAQVGLGNVLNAEQLVSTDLEEVLTDDITKVASSGGVYNFVDGEITTHTAIADAHHTNAYDPTADEKLALSGSYGSPSASNKYLTEDGLGVANGVASLDVNGDVPLDQIPDTLTGKSADMLDGKHLWNAGSGEPLDVIPWIGLDSVMDVGKYLDFHTTDSVADYDIRFQCLDADTLRIIGGNIDVVGKIYADKEIVISPQDGTSEGGELELEGAGTYDDWGVDVFQDHLRMFNITQGNTVMRIYNDKVKLFAGPLQMNDENVENVNILTFGISSAARTWSEYLDYTQCLCLKATDNNNFGDFRFYSEKTETSEVKEMFRINGDDSIIEVGGNRITGMGTPTGSSDATTKAYVDGLFVNCQQEIDSGWIEWNHNYSVPTNSSLPIVKRDGTEFSTTDDREFIVYGYTVATGGISGTIARFKADNGGVWSVDEIYNYGNDAQKPTFIIDTNGKPAVHQGSTTHGYTISVKHISTSNGSRIFQHMVDTLTVADKNIAGGIVEIDVDGNINAQARQVKFSPDKYIYEDQNDGEAIKVRVHTAQARPSFIIEDENGTVVHELKANAGGGATFTGTVSVGGLDVGSQKITNVADPTDAQDAATKNYVDTLKDTIVSKTSAYTATINDDVILCNGTFTVTLPVASTATGCKLNIKNIGTGTITIDGDGSETIDGATTVDIATQYNSFTLVCDGSAWYII